MNRDRLTRRQVLVGSAATVTAAMLPVSPPAPILPSVEATSASASLEYGYSFNEEWYQTGFASREEAIAEAISCGEEGSFTTAVVRFYNLRMPFGLAEDAANALADEEWQIGDWLANQLAGANQDGDYEGDFESACFAVSRTELGDAGRKAIAASLRRAGATSYADQVDAGECPVGQDIPESILEAVAADKTLEGELLTALGAFADKHNLAGELRGLMTNNIQDHEVPEELEDDLLATGDGA